jgi:Lytic polysaccharide mono-oxygenase, cellulose-degrading
MPNLQYLSLTACIISIFAQNAHGHAFLALPKARNVLANSYYCPHCLNAGNVNVTRGTVYPINEGKHGMCGDRAAGPLDHEAGGKFATGQIAATYEQGSAIQMAAAVATYHKGLIEYRICKYPAGDAESERAALTDECLDQHILKQITTTSDENTPPQAPGSRYYFLGNASDTGYDPPRVFYHTFQLPEDLVCDGEDYKCVLQFHYITGNTCNDPALPDKFKLSYLPDCGEQGSWPEEFWNCADIAIVSNNGGSGNSGVVITQPDPSQPAFSPALMQGPSVGPKAASVSEFQAQHPSLFAFVVHRKFYGKGGKAVEEAMMQREEEGDNMPRSWRRALKSVY